MDVIKALHDRISEARSTLVKLDAYWSGTQPAAFLPKEAAEALNGRLKTLSVNFPRLAVESLSERLRPTGFILDGQEKADEALWKLWRINGMEDAAAQAHTDALVYGRSFVIVWAGKSGKPQVSIESPLHMAVLRDPGTRQITSALKRWVDPDAGKAYSVLYEADKITKMVALANASDDASIPSTGWETTEVLRNPLGVVPVVALVNRGRLSEVDGVSEMADVLDLADALNKLMADAMVGSEFYARPRRWVTGLEIVEDEDGNAVNPFSDESGKLWQSENDETRFGEFSGSSLDGYAGLTATVTQQIGALTGLPPHYLGLNGDQPPSADSIRSAESSLVSRAYSLQRTFGTGWREVARLMVAIRDTVDVSDVDLSVVWANPETRTPAQAADAALKQKGIGVPLPMILADTLGFTPTQVATAMRLTSEAAPVPAPTEGNDNE